MKKAIIIAAVVLITVAAFIFLRKPDYRGAVGFKNHQASEIATIRLTGFSKPIVSGPPLAEGDHFFNHFVRESIPSEVQIAWRFIGDTADKTANVSLSSVPKYATDGELFF